MSDEIGNKMRLDTLERENRALKVRMENYEIELGKISGVYSNVLQMLGTSPQSRRR